MNSPKVVAAIGHSRARLVLQALNVPSIRDRISKVEIVKVEDKDVEVYRLKGGTPKIVAGAGVEMLDGRKLVFFSDGSLRRIRGARPGKAGRKAIKRLRHRTRGRA